MTIPVGSPSPSEKISEQHTRDEYLKLALNHFYSAEFKKHAKRAEYKPNDLEHIQKVQEIMAKLSKDNKFVEYNLVYTHKEAFNAIYEKQIVDLSKKAMKEKQVINLAEFLNKVRLDVIAYDESRAASTFTIDKKAIEEQVKQKIQLDAKSIVTGSILKAFDEQVDTAIAAHKNHEKHKPLETQPNSLSDQNQVVKNDGSAVVPRRSKIKDQLDLDREKLENSVAKFLANESVQHFFESEIDKALSSFGESLLFKHKVATQVMDTMRSPTMLQYICFLVQNDQAWKALYFTPNIMLVTEHIVSEARQRAIRAFLLAEKTDAQILNEARAAKQQEQVKRGLEKEKERKIKEKEKSENTIRSIIEDIGAQAQQNIQKAAEQLDSIKEDLEKLRDEIVRHLSSQPVKVTGEQTVDIIPVETLTSEIYSYFDEWIKYLQALKDHKTTLEKEKLACEGEQEPIKEKEVQTNPQAAPEEPKFKIHFGNAFSEFVKMKIYSIHPMLNEGTPVWDRILLSPILVTPVAIYHFLNRVTGDYDQARRKSEEAEIQRQKDVAHFFAQQEGAQHSPSKQSDSNSVSRSESAPDLAPRRLDFNEEKQMSSRHSAPNLGRTGDKTHGFFCRMFHHHK